MSNEGNGIKTLVFSGAYQGFEEALKSACLSEDIPVEVSRSQGSVLCRVVHQYVEKIQGILTQACTPKYDKEYPIITLFDSVFFPPVGNGNITIVRGRSYNHGEIYKDSLPRMCSRPVDMWRSVKNVGE